MAAYEAAPLASYEEEMRASREELLRKIERSSTDIAAQCGGAVASSTEGAAASLFDDDERERVVAAYAAKLKNSRDELVARIEATQASERAQLVDAGASETGDFNVPSTRTFNSYIQRSYVSKEASALGDPEGR